MNKKVVVLGGGHGLSVLLKGLKQFPLDITAIVSVCDDGKSTGRLREEFNIPAVGDIRRVIVSLSETEPLFEELLNYRFETNSDLNGHALGNLLLTALTNITGNMSEGIQSLSKVLNLKGKVLPLTEDNVVLMAKMTDGTIIEGEHNITMAHKVIEKVYYTKEPKIVPEVLESIQEADLILLSMGSLFTSILPNLLCNEILSALDQCKAPILYISNLMTQPGETDSYTVSDHVCLLNQYLGKKKVQIVVANNGDVKKESIEKYAVLEQKDPVIFDKEKLNAMGLKIIEDNFIDTTSGVIRHNVIKLAFHIFSLLM